MGITGLKLEQKRSGTKIIERRDQLLSERSKNVSKEKNKFTRYIGYVAPQSGMVSLVLYLPVVWSIIIIRPNNQNGKTLHLYFLNIIYF